MAASSLEKLDAQGRDSPSMTDDEEAMITQNQLKDVLHYSPDTGVFVWRKKADVSSLGGNTRVGNPAGYLCRGYLRIKVNGKTYQANRLAWIYMFGVNPSGVVDHIDHDTTNNSISNLRDVSVAGNAQNQIKAHKANKTSGLLGVSYCKVSRKYMATISVNGKNIHLGSHINPLKAHEIYLSAKRQLHLTNTL